MNTRATASFSLSDALSDATGLIVSPINLGVHAEIKAGAHKQVTHQENALQKTLIKEAGYQVGTRSETQFLHHAMMSSQLSTTFSITTEEGGPYGAATQKVFDGVSPTSLKDLKAQHPAQFEAVQTLLADAKSGDQIEVQYRLPTALVVKANELADPASAQYNPKAAKALVADKSNYELASVRRVLFLSYLQPIK